MPNVTELLKKLGFSEYESKAYISLIGAGACNGYQIAKDTGMPRANVYSVLERLVARGAAQRQNTPKGKLYSAIAPKRLLNQLATDHQQTLDAAGKALALLEHKTQNEPVFNLDNYQHMLQQAKSLIDHAHTQLSIGIQPTEAAELAEPLQKARDRGVKITTLCMESCPHNCGGCQGDLYRFDILPHHQDRWLLVVRDAKQALAGQIDATQTAAITTEQRQIVEIISAFISQSLSLSLLSTHLGDRFDGLLSSAAQKMLTSS